MTDPVQEARDALIITNDGRRPGFRADLAWFERAIRREEAARVLPVLRSMYQPALEFRCEDDSYGWHCTTCGVGILDAHEEWCAYGPVAAEITRLEALRGGGDA